MVKRIFTTGVAACIIISADPPGVRAGAKTGTVTVASEPAGAVVYLDGQFAGRTPVTVERVQPGDHRVRVVKEGFLENGRIVAVGAGQTATLQLRLTASGASNDSGGQQTGGGISSGPPPGSKKKWWYLGAAGGGAVATAVVLATRNSAPIIGTVSASPSTGLQAATPIAFSAAGASDPDGDPLTYSWNFGDGSTSNEPAPRHVYNSPGTFSVQCTISDGNKHSANGSTSVTVRSLAGTWRGVLDNVQETLVITQSGAAVEGTFVDEVYGSGRMNGFVSTSSPLVRITVIQPGFNPFTYTADPNAEITTLTGVVNGSGFNNRPFTVSRQ
jgi:hypothetical protein